MKEGGEGEDGAGGEGKSGSNGDGGGCTEGGGGEGSHDAYIKQPSQIGATGNTSAQVQQIIGCVLQSTGPDVGAGGAGSGDGGGGGEGTHRM